MSALKGAAIGPYVDAMAYDRDLQVVMGRHTGGAAPTALRIVPAPDMLGSWAEWLEYAVVELVALLNSRQWSILALPEELESAVRCAKVSGVSRHTSVHYFPALHPALDPQATPMPRLLGMLAAVAATAAPPTPLRHASVATAHLPCLHSALCTACAAASDAGVSEWACPAADTAPGMVLAEAALFKRRGTPHAARQAVDMRGCAMYLHGQCSATAAHSAVWQMATAPGVHLVCSCAPGANLVCSCRE